MYDALNKAKLYSVDALIGGYRVHAGQLSFQDMEANHRIHDEYIAAELARDPGLRSVKLFRRLSKFAQSIPKLRGLWNAPPCALSTASPVLTCRLSFGSTGAAGSCNIPVSSLGVSHG